MAFSCFYKTRKTQAIRLSVIPEKKYKTWLQDQDALLVNYLTSLTFEAIAGNYVKIADQNGHFIQVVLIVSADDMWMLGDISKKLPAGDYILDDPYECADSEDVYLGFGLGCYQFSHYKSKKPAKRMKLYLPKVYSHVEKTLRAIYLTRDMINTPAEDMGPAEIAHQAQKLAQTFSASFSEITGQTLKQRYPGVYTVGRASTRAPRVVKIHWGDKSNPHIVLVGKGVAFDTGGLDIKPSSGMLLMHKDMGGAAHVLGLARLIMDRQLPVYLTVVIPTVDNAISGDAYRPSDIITMANGSTVEISNTDAEGRVIMADVLYEASNLSPDLLIDFATLTGAARVAVGTEIAAFFCNNQKLAKLIEQSSETTQDPVWRMPLYQPYKKLLKSDAADMKNCALGAYAGSITAALFLETFIEKNTNWLHFDMMGWNVQEMPGRPKGGEAMGVRAVFDMLAKKYLE
ncbi:leucyl aminopeptidase family protein [Facilibium subflavum]|uniref:leucyl aminopeptidase family protein n=1 Tax=Facilibium subflavum TaxID=2219058 RepID=UPI000E64986F|nr:leucyl aminopeptidase family protein [Facilibium subflavum]